MDKVSINSELTDLNSNIKSAFEEAHSIGELNFESIDLNPKAISITLPFVAKDQEVFLNTYLPLHAARIISVKNPVIYFFSITETLSNKEAAELVSNLYTFKQGIGKKQFLLPKILKKIPETSERVLYVGSKKKSFYIRVCQHLGFCRPDTQGLNLYNLPEPLKRELKLHYCELQTVHPLTITILEQSLHKKLRPLIGDAPYYG